MLEETYKSVNGLGPPILQRIYTLKTHTYSMRSGQNLQLPKMSSKMTNSFDFRAILAWNQLPDAVKTSSSLSRFKSKLKEVAIYCKCDACK